MTLPQNNHDELNEESGFSLVELIVVMGIIALLGLLSWAGFLGLRRSMIVHQSAESFKSDVIYAQRSAMFLERGIKDNWVRGIGVDLRNLDDTDPFYSEFKWCSSVFGYQDFNGAATLPHDSPNVFPFPDGCDAEGLFELLGKGRVATASGAVDVCFVPGTAGTDLSDPLTPQPGNTPFIVFESVNGRGHVYTNDGTLAPGIDGIIVYFVSGSLWDKVEIRTTGEVRLYTYDPAETPCDSTP